ncbi:MAG: adenylate kinase [Nitrososphaera sp.]|nr:adenylate kinase [Nitrososphaera sp.]
MAGNKRVIIVGIPGVGKTTVISHAAEILSKSRKTTVTVFGTLMFEEAKKIGLQNRDEMRKLPVEKQRHLQELAAKNISEMQDDVVIVDTHLFINTNEGYYPGLPMRLLSIMNPTNLVLISADPQQIVDRRRNDSTRQRDVLSAQAIQKELNVSEEMIAACSIITGAPFSIVMNGDNMVDEAAGHVVKILGGETK